MDNPLLHEWKTIEEKMVQSPHQGAAAAYYCGDLSTAVKVARQIAVAGDIVLLSPGCASQDQFINFEQRGKQFTTLARAEN